MLKKHDIRIGVLGGIGPESTARFYKLLIDRLQKEGITANKDYPHIIINSIPAPELFAAKDNREALKEYIAGLEFFETQNISFIIIVCNTAHAFMDIFTSKIKTPIIEFPEYLSNKIVYIDNKILVIGSSIINTHKVYSHKNIFYPTNSEQKMIDDVIVNFNSGKEKNAQRETLLNIINQYGDCTVLAACTEVDLILADVNMEHVSTLDLMVEACVERLMKLRGSGA